MTGRVLIALVLAAAAMAGERGSARVEARAGVAAAASVEFQAAGIYWTHGSPRVRASEDGAAWSEWFDVHAEAVIEGRNASELIWFGGRQRFVQVEGADAEVLLIQPGNGPPTSGKPRAAATRPEIVSREQWGCTPATCVVKEAPAYTTPTHLVVHHSAGGNTSSDWSAVVRSIFVLHTQGNGWNDIGYNYLVDPLGVVYEGRAGGDGVLGAHFSGVNSGTAGICVLGTYSATAPSEISMLVLRDTLAWLAERWNIDPIGHSIHASSGLELNHISGHRDAGLSPRASGSTECPGNGVYARLAALRRETAALLDAECPLRLGPVSRCMAPDATALSIPVETPGACDWTALSRAPWIRVERRDSGAFVSIDANTGAERAGTIRIGPRAWTFTQAAAGRPGEPCPESLVSAASLDPRPVTPGSAVTIFGSGLEGASVSINGRAAQTLFSGPTQINAIIPAATPIGTARVTVGSGPPLLFSVSENVPAIFAGADGRALVNEPGAPGAAVTLFTAGITATSATVLVDDVARPASVTSVAELPGLRLVTFTLPESTAPGDHRITVRAGGVDSAESRLLVR